MVYADCLRAVSQGALAIAFLLGSPDLWLIPVQREVPPAELSRIMSYLAFGAYSIGPIGLALAGPISEATSISAVLAVGVGWQLLASAVVLALPAVRQLDQPDGAAGP